MRVYFESDHALGEQFRAAVLRKARSATRRLSYAVSRAKVKFTQVLRAGGVPDQQCRVELTVGESSTVVATARAADWSDALDGALRRAASALPAIHRRSRLRSRQTDVAHSAHSGIGKPGSNDRVVAAGAAPAVGVRPA